MASYGPSGPSIRTVTEINGKEVPNKRPDQKIDLTRPFDPAGEAAPNANYKWERQKDGTEKLKIGGKEYDCTWTTYKPVPAKPADLDSAFPQ